MEGLDFSSILQTNQQMQYITYYSNVEMSVNFFILKTNYSQKKTSVILLNVNLICS
jgi:hypothetical protein